MSEHGSSVAGSQISNSKGGGSQQSYGNSGNSNSRSRRPPPPPFDDAIIEEDERSQSYRSDGEYEEDNDNGGFAKPRLVVDREGQLDASLLVRTEGFIYKKGGVVNSRGGRRNWKHRWFKLEPIDYNEYTAYELRYYDGRDGDLKGSVSLFDVEIYCEQKSQHSKVKFEFQILLQNGGVLQLSCDDEQERQEWIDTLNMVIAYIRKLTSNNSVALNGYDPLYEDNEDIYTLGEEIAQQSRAFGPGIFGAEAGHKSPFTIQINDISGQTVTVGGMPITVTLSNKDLLYYIRVIDNSDGTYACQYSVVTPGYYELAVKINDEHHIADSPFQVQVLPSKTVPNFCSAEGACLTTVNPTGLYSFKIIAKDMFNNRKVSGGDPFEIGIIGPGYLHSLSDDSDGSYTCTFELKSPENMSFITSKSIKISVTLHGKHILASPFTPTIVNVPTKNAVNSIVPVQALVFAPPATAPAVLNAKSSDNEQQQQQAVIPAVGSILSQLQQSRQQLASNDNNKSSNNVIKNSNANNNSNNNSNNNNNAGKPVDASRTSNINNNSSNNNNNNTNTSSSSNNSIGNNAQSNPNSRTMAQLSNPSINSKAAEPRPTTSSATPFSDSPSVSNNSSGNALTKLERARQKAMMIKSLQGGGGGVIGSEQPATIQQQAQQQRLTTSDLVSSNSQGNAVSAVNASPNTQVVPVGGRRASITGQGRTAAVKKAVSSEDSMRYLGEAKRGLVGNLPMTASIDDHNIWKATHDALTVSEEMGNIIFKNMTSFRSVFEAFFEIVDGVEMIRTTNASNTGFYRLLEEFKIVPDVVSKNEVKSLFSLMLTCQRNIGSPCTSAGAGLGLDFPHFVKLLVMTSLFAFSKTGNASKPRYNDAEAKVESLFTKWGLSDALKLQVMKVQLKNASK